MKYPLRNLGYARSQGKVSRGNTSSLTLSQFPNSVLEKVKDLMHVTLLRKLNMRQWFLWPLFGGALFDQNTFKGGLPIPHARNRIRLYSFFICFPAMVSFVATVADATSMTALATTIARVMYNLILLL